MEAWGKVVKAAELFFALPILPERSPANYSPYFTRLFLKGLLCLVALLLKNVPFRQTRYTTAASSA
jgi:hypothetical protein